MEIVKIILTVLECVASIVLIAAVLMQSGKEAGLSGALSGSNDNYLSKSKKKNLDQALSSATKWIALAWIVVTLILSLI